jgi:signal transduction histidine kinase
MPLSTAVTVFRFFQETLLNVVKHADVDDARVALRFDADKLVAQVADDGPGFVPEEVRPDRGRHVGLGLLRERIRLAGGTLDVVSAPGRGTTLTMSMPLRQPARDGGRELARGSQPPHLVHSADGVDHRGDSDGPDSATTWAAVRS